MLLRSTSDLSYLTYHCKNTSSLAQPYVRLRVLKLRQLQNHATLEKVKVIIFYSVLLRGRFLQSSPCFQNVVAYASGNNLFTVDVSQSRGKRKQHLNLNRYTMILFQGITISRFFFFLGPNLTFFSQSYLVNRFLIILLNFHT